MRVESGICETCGNSGMCINGLCLKHHQQKSSELVRELAGSTETDQAFNDAKKSIQILCDILLLKEQNKSSLHKTTIGAAGNTLINGVESMREFDK